MSDTKTPVQNSRMEITNNNVMIKYDQQSINRIRNYYINNVAKLNSENLDSINTSKKIVETK